MEGILSDSDYLESQGEEQNNLNGEFGEAEIVIPRDRNGAFEPQLIEKGQTRFTGFDGKILSLYARGMTTRDIQGQLQDLYGVNLPYVGVYGNRGGGDRAQSLAEPES